jgi:hypothetical protein
MLRHSLPMIAISRAPFGQSAKGSQGLDSPLTINRHSRLDRSHEERSVYDRALRTGESGLTDEIPEWRCSIEDRKYQVAARSRIMAQPFRSERHESIAYHRRVVSRRRKSPMLDVSVLVAVVGFFGLSVIYSYPLTGMVFLGTLVYYAFAHSERS